MNDKIRENKKIGLALGGGSALAFGHFGVLKALKEGGIKIDYISGTSAGAIAGALFAFGVSFIDIEAEAQNIDWKKIAKLKLSSMSIFSNTALRKLLEKHLGKHTDIKNAEIPLAITVADIETGDRTVLKSGNVVDAVMASSCMPGIFPPVEINGHFYIDGGLVENVPVTPLYDAECGIKIGVNLLHYRKYQKPKNMIDVLINSFDMINKRISAQPHENGFDFLIQPDLSDFYMTDIKKWKQIYKKGYEEGQKYVDAIKEIQRRESEENFWGKIKELFNFKNEG